MGRRSNEQLLLDLVPSDQFVGNKTLIRHLQKTRAWPEEKYWRVRQQLIDKGLLIRGKGKGGSVGRPDETPMPELVGGDTGAEPPREHEGLSDDAGDAGEPGGKKDGSPYPVLKYVRFESWKSFRDATLFVDPLTVLIGTNASGKSNALDGFQFLNRTALGKELRVALGGDPTLAQLRGGIEWSAIQGSTTFRLEVSVKGEEERTEYQYSIAVDTQPRVQVQHESLKRIRHRPGTSERPYEVYLLNTDPPDSEHPSITMTLYNGRHGTKKEAHRSASLLSQLAGQILGARLPQEVVSGVAAVSRALRGIFVLDPIPSAMRGFSQFSESLRGDAANIAGVLAALPKDQRREVETTLTHYIKELPERDVRKVWAEPVGRFQTDAMLYCEEAWVPGGSTTTVDARGMSDGTLRMLGILTALLTRPEGSVLVIEEVDNGLHPSRSELLVRMLRELGERRRIDVLVTTHNPALLDALGPAMVPFVVVAHRDPETGESRLSLLEEIGALPKLMAGGSLGTLSARGQIEQTLEQEARSA